MNYYCTRTQDVPSVIYDRHVTNKYGVLCASKMYLTKFRSCVILSRFHNSMPFTGCIQGEAFSHVLRGTNTPRTHIP